MLILIDSRSTSWMAVADSIGWQCFKGRVHTEECACTYRSLTHRMARLHSAPWRRCPRCRRCPPVRRPPRRRMARRATCDMTRRRPRCWRPQCCPPQPPPAVTAQTASPSWCTQDRAFHRVSHTWVCLILGLIIMWYAEGTGAANPSSYTLNISCKHCKRAGHDRD